MKHLFIHRSLRHMGDFKLPPGVDPEQTLNIDLNTPAEAMRGFSFEQVELIGLHPVEIPDELRKAVDYCFTSARAAAPVPAPAPKTTGLTIGQAVEALREGKKVQREGWNGKRMHLELQVPDAGSKMTQPYAFLHTANGDNVPWTCSQADLLADDWQVVAEVPAELPAWLCMLLATAAAAVQVEATA